MFLAVPFSENNIKIWCAERYCELGELSGHQGPIFDLSFSSDSSKLISGSDDKSAIVWDTINFIKIEELKHDSRVITSSFNSLGDRLLTSTFNAIRIFRSSTFTLILKINNLCSGIPRAFFSVDDSLIIAASHLSGRQQSVRMWCAASGLVVDTVQANQLNMTPRPISHLVPNPTGSFAVIVYDNGHLNCLMLHTKKVVAVGNLEANGVAFSNDGSRIAMAVRGYILVFRVQCDDSTVSFTDLQRVQSGASILALNGCGNKLVIQSLNYDSVTGNHCQQIVLCDIERREIEEDGDGGVETDPVPLMLPRFLAKCERRGSFKEHYAVTFSVVGNILM